jgi:hypothetical protein
MPHHGDGTDVRPKDALGLLPAAKVGTSNIFVLLPEPDKHIFLSSLAGRVGELKLRWVQLCGSAQVTLLRGPTRALCLV